MRSLLDLRHRLLFPLSRVLHLVRSKRHLKADPLQQHPTLHLRPPLHDSCIHRLEQQDGNLGEIDPQGTGPPPREKEDETSLGRE